MDVEYDNAKNQRNIELRGLSFELARAFDLETATVWQDTRQDYKECRFSALGFIGTRLYAVTFTPRGDRLRIISLRKANKREEHLHEQAQSKIDR